MPDVIPAQSAAEGNAILWFDDWLDGAAIHATTSAAITDAAASHLLTTQPSDVYGTEATSVVIVASRPGVLPINHVGLLFTNAHSATTWRVRVADTEAGLTGVPSFDSGTVFVWEGRDLSFLDRPHALMWLPEYADYTPQLEASWLRIDLATVPTPFYAGRLWAMNAWQPSRNVQFGFGVGFEARWKGTNIGPATVVRRVPPPPRLRFRFAHLLKGEAMEKAYRFDRAAAEGREVVACLAPRDAAHRQELTVYGTVTPGGEIVPSAHVSWEREYELKGLE